MRLLKRKPLRAEPLEPPAPAPPPPEPGIRVSRTLVKSEPELTELIEAEPRLRAEGVEVSLTQKGFGTRVAIAVLPGTPLDEPELEQILDGLAEPQKRPFSAG